MLRSIVATCMLGIAGVVSAQTWPDKPLRIIVPFAAGGLTDTVARTLQPRLSESLGQQVVVENRPGASGTIGEAALAKSAPDGYTMMLSVDSLPASPHLIANLPYDVFRDLAPISMIARIPLVLIVHPSVPAGSVSDLVRDLRARPGPFAFASPGSGTSNHLYLELFKGIAGVEMTHVAYKGGGPALTDLVGGQVQALLISATLGLPQVRGGKVKALAVTSERRLAALPGVQTFVEAGWPEFTPHTWTGLFVPTGTPQPIRDRLFAEYAKAVKAPEVDARLRELTAEPVMNSPAEFAAFLKAETARLGKLIRERRIEGG